MKKLLFSILLVLITSLIHSQGTHLEWAKQMGGVTYESGFSIAVDKSNNVYTTGFHMGAGDYDPGSGVYNLYCSGDEDIFIQKLDQNGNFIWAKKIGAQSDQIAWAIDVDTNNNVYVAGNFANTVDFDPGPNTFNLSSSYSKDMFVLKLDSNGSFIWAKQLSGTSTKSVKSIKVDHLGDILVTGYFSGTVDFDPDTSTTHNMYTNYGSGAVFILKLDSNGNYLWVKSAGGAGLCRGIGVDVDTSNNVYVCGYFTLIVDFDPGTPIQNDTSYGGSDMFVLKLNSSGIYQWSRHMGGPGTDQSNAIICDNYGNVYTTGNFYDSVDFDPGIDTTMFISSGYNDIYVQKLSSNGDFEWASHIATTHYDYGKGIAIDNNQNVYTTGQYNSGDTYISKHDSLGNLVYLNTNLNGYSNGEDILVDDDDYIYVTGLFSGTNDFDFSMSSFNISSFGAWDIFTAKYSQCNLSGSVDSVIACSSYTWMDGITYTSSNNTATYTLTNAVGCDSVISLYLIINSPSVSVDSVVACDTFTWVNGVTYSSSNDSASIVLTNSNGCDSILSLDLVINPSYSIIDNIIACNQYTWMDGNTYTSSNSTAYQTLVSSKGCDSTIFLNLTIDSVSDISVSQTGNTIISNNISGSFQWLDCNNNYSIISGETNNIYIPTVNGNYAVEITENNCIDTSICVSIISISLQEHDKNSVKLYPNPNNGDFYIDFGELDVESFTISTVQGKMVYKHFKPMENSIHLSLDLPPSVYILKLNTTTDVYFYKIVIQE